MNALNIIRDLYFMNMDLIKLPKWRFIRRYIINNKIKALSIELKNENIFIVTIAFMSFLSGSKVDYNKLKNIYYKLDDLEIRINGYNIYYYDRSNQFIIYNRNMQFTIYNSIKHMHSEIKPIWDNLSKDMIDTFIDNISIIANEYLSK